MFSRASGLTPPRTPPGYEAAEAAAESSAIGASAASAASAPSEAAPSAPPEAHLNADPHPDAQANAADNAAVHAFWMPNDVWRSVAEFSSHADLLNLRTANSDITAQVDHAFTSATIRGGDVSAFTQSDHYAQLKTLRLEGVDQPDLLLLAQHLLAHPRPELVIDFAHGSRLTAPGAAALAALQLERLDIKHSPLPDAIDALATCGFPVTLEGYLFDATFAALSRVPTLEKLIALGVGIKHDWALKFANHPALETLSVGIADSGPIIEALAGVPRLRDLCLRMINPEAFTIASARALAASPTLNTLTIVSQEAITEDMLAALSQSQSLSSLTMPLFLGMHALPSLPHLKHLNFNNWSVSVFAHPEIIDADTMQNIAAAQALESISFPDRAHEPGALVALFRDGSANKLEFARKMVFNDDERAALMADTKLSTLVFKEGVEVESDVALLRQHPTLAVLRIGAEEYRRRPGEALLT